jgi:hypothetical protein
VEDDGAGFDQSSPAAGMGLANMRERAAAFDGTLAVQSRPGGGTLVTLDVPYALWAQGDVAQYRRRVFLWAAMTLAWVLIVARTHSDWIGGLALVIINAVVCLRAAVAWHRARRRAEASQWIESPSHS